MRRSDAKRRARLANAVPPASADDGTFIVHEWGTFTSYSGSDGVRLDFRPLVESDLPDFVCDWTKWTGQLVFTKCRIRARQRMETPVTYFCTDRVREVDVQVGFPGGILTEFYPPARRVEPQNLPATGTGPGLLAEHLRNGLIDWGRVTLLPESALRPNIGADAVADAISRRAFQSLPPRQRSGCGSLYRRSLLLRPRQRLGTRACAHVA
jgi:hypothetical protein